MLEDLWKTAQAYGETRQTRSKRYSTTTSRDGGTRHDSRVDRIDFQFICRAHRRFRRRHGVTASSWVCAQASQTSSRSTARRAARCPAAAVVLHGADTACSTCCWLAGRRRDEYANSRRTNRIRAGCIAMSRTACWPASAPVSRDYFGISVKGLRWLTVFGSCFFAMPAVIFICYDRGRFPAAAQARRDLYHNEGEETFWRTVRRDPHYTCDDIRSKYRDLDRRLQGMEHYVTSPRFDLDQKVQGSGVRQSAGAR